MACRSKAMMLAVTLAAVGSTLLVTWLVTRAAATQGLQINTKELSSSVNVTDGVSTDLHLPSAAIYDHPWVKSNIALTSAHRTQDGVGSQTLRLLSVYAIAKSLGVRHLFRPIVCVGHVGNQTFYHGSCNPQNEHDKRLLDKAQHMILLPSTATENDVRDWTAKELHAVGEAPAFERLTALVEAAFTAKQPTLISIVSVPDMIKKYPDMFLTVPQLTPRSPPAMLACQKGMNPAANATVSFVRTKPWLMEAVRIAVHIRRGDIQSDKILLPTGYFITLANMITALLHASGCYYSLEIYTEAPLKPEHVAEIKQLQQSLPSSVVLVETELMWTWQMMASADILVMSNSMFSLSAAVLNPDAVLFHVPDDGYNTWTGQFRMRHWLVPNNDGRLPPKALANLKSRIMPAELPDAPPEIVFAHYGEVRPHHTFCVLQARRSNPTANITVIIHRDSDVKAWQALAADTAINIYAPATWELLDNFEAVYKHASINKYSKDMYCIYRHLMLYHYMVEYNLQSLLYLDLDIVLFDDLSKFIPPDSTVSNLGTFAIHWTQHSLSAFTHYIWHFYQREPREIAKKMSDIGLYRSDYQGKLTKDPLVSWWPKDMPRYHISDMWLFLDFIKTTRALKIVCPPPGSKFGVNGECPDVLQLMRNLKLHHSLIGFEGTFTGEQVQQLFEWVRHPKYNFSQPFMSSNTADGATTSAVPAIHFQGSTKTALAALLCGDLQSQFPHNVELQKACTSPESTEQEEEM